VRKKKEYTRVPALKRGIAGEENILHKKALKLP